jgi:hypothetical protein
MRLYLFLVVGLLQSVGVLLAQDCNLIKETDPFTRQTRVSTGFMELTGASMVADADSKEIDIMITFKTDRCFDDGCTAMIYFEGGKQKLSLRNGGTMNCEGLFHFIFRNGPTVNYQLKKMATQPISHMEFVDRNDKKIPVTLSVAQQEKLLQVLRCFIDQAPSLVQ